MLKDFIRISLIILILNTAAAGEETIRLTSGEWAPHISENLKHYGVVSHIITESFASENIKVEYEFFPWKRSYILSKSGEFDGSIVWAPSLERKKDFYFTAPVIFSKKVFFHLKKYPFDWQTLDDLKGLQIGLIAQYSYGDAFDQAVKEGRLNAQYIYKDKFNLKKLLAKRIHIFAMEIDAGYSMIHSEFQPEQIDLITHHPTPLQQTPFCVIISKQINPDRAKRLVASFNIGISRLKEKGLYDQFIIESKHGKYQLRQ